MGNPRVTNGHRRRQIRRRVLAYYSICAICDEPVDKTLPAGHPFAPEVDEIIPVSLGGSPYRWDNCVLSHRLCNQRRGNKSLPAARSAHQRKAAPTRPQHQQPITSRAW